MTTSGMKDGAQTAKVHEPRADLQVACWNVEIFRVIKPASQYVSATEFWGRVAHVVFHRFAYTPNNLPIIPTNFICIMSRGMPS